MDEFIKYRSFNDKAIALQLYQKLTDEGFVVKWEDSEGFFDASFANNDFLNLYYIKLRREDFEKADRVLEKTVTEMSGEPSADYYLFSFSDEELIDVLQKKDEWNEFDTYWARKILKQRGIEVNPVQLAEMKNQRIADLKQPWELHSLWVIGSLALPFGSMYVMNPYGAAGTILLGLYVSYSKKTLPDGQRVKAFTERNRVYGKIYSLLGVIALVWMITRIYELSR